MKHIIISAILCVLVLSGCNKAQNTNVQSPTASQEATATKAAFEDVQSSQIVKELEYPVQEEHINAKLLYPSFGNEKIDQIIYNYVESRAAIDLKDIKDSMDGIPAEMLERGFGYYLNYQVLRNDSKAIDILLEYGSYTGGAHGNTWLKTFMFDPKTGEEIDGLSLIDNDKSKALQILSEKAPALIKEKLNYSDDEMNSYNADLTPKEENFRHILRTNDGKIRVYFDPYAVAPWAEGIVFIDL